MGGVRGVGAREGRRRSVGCVCTSFVFFCLFVNTYCFLKASPNFRSNDFSLAAHPNWTRKYPQW